MGFDYQGTAELFELIWHFFTDWTIPVINLSPANFIISMIFLGLILRVLSSLLGISSGAISLGFNSAVNDIKSERNTKKWLSDRRKGGKL